MGEAVSDGPLVLATVYRIVYDIVACYIIARLAPDWPLAHALVGGAVGLVVSIVGAAVTWNKGPAFGPHWYPLALIVTAIPCAWLGGKPHEMKLRARAELHVMEKFSDEEYWNMTRNGGDSKSEQKNAEKLGELPGVFLRGVRVVKFSPPCATVTRCLDVQRASLRTGPGHWLGKPRPVLHRR
jgi:hypothetical protein